MVRKSRRRNNPSADDVEAQSQDEGAGHRGAHEMSTRTSGRDGKALGATGGNAPAGQADHEDQTGSSTWSQAPKDGPPNSGGDHSTPGDTTQPMIGDFDDSANALWTLHMKEAKSHDKARIQSLKDDMDGVLIFAGLYSAALVSFIIDKLHDLKVDPAEQMVYYQQQNVALLAQISQLTSTIAQAIVPQGSIPLTPSSPPYPNFTPKSADVRVNAFWFMSLVFSLSAALLATLVQQWVRDYMDVFQRYSSPLKSARLRQYLYEGAEGWYMPVVAESVPALIHISLFLFFLGLGDSLFDINTTIATTTIIPIAICGFLYILSTFTPIVNPQSPYQNQFTRLIWYLIQNVHPRSYSDRASGGALKTVSSNMSEGRAQLAMEENAKRQGRDVQAIRWLIDNSTEDDEMESFVMAIPGSLTSEQGVKVWSGVSKVRRDEDTNFWSSDSHNGSSVPQHTYHSPMTPNDPHAAIYYLCKRVQHLVDTCNNRSLFANEELWRRRARGCVGAVASLVFRADIKLELFGNLGSLLSELGGFEKNRALSAAGFNETFVTRWTCLSLLVVTLGIADHGAVGQRARTVIDHLSRFRGLEDDGGQINHGDTDENALKNARRIDNYFETASQFCLRKLCGAIREIRSDDAEAMSEVWMVLKSNRDDILELERITPAADQMESIDMFLSDVNSIIRSVDHGLNVNLPGVSFDEFKETGHIQPARFFNPSDAEGQEFTAQFIFLRQRLRHLCSYARPFRNIQGDINNAISSGVYQKTLGNLRTLCDKADRGRSIVHQRHLMERQLWRLQDLRDGGGFGFSVELFFLVLPRLYSMASSRDTHSALYIRTFRDITSGWRERKHSIGTQRVILNLICDIAIPFRGIFSDREYPEHVTKELLELLRNMVEGQSGSHIDDALEDLGQPDVDNPFAAQVMEVISARVPPS